MIFCRPLRKQDFADRCMLLLAGNGIRFPIAINYYIPVCNNYCVLCTTFAFQIKFCSTETSHIQKPLRSVEITLLPLAFFFLPGIKGEEDNFNKDIHCYFLKGECVKVVMPA